MLQTAGAFDPAGGVGVGFRFNSLSPFSGVHDPKLDALLARRRARTNLTTRGKFYHQAAQYIAKNCHGPFHFPFAPANVAVHGVGGPGLYHGAVRRSWSCRRSRGRTFRTTRRAVTQRIRTQLEE